MQELADQLNTSVALGAQDGVDMLYVACRASRKVATLRLGVGSVLPMAATSIGRAYLWGLPTNERSVLLDEHLRKAGAKGKELAHAIQASFVELDATGTCAVMGGYQRDAFGVALPLRVGKSKILMALSCGKADVGADLRSEHARITPVLIEAARSLELLLGTINGHL
jgi:DNA-binding IclR family transcriptional regulator